MRLTLALTVGVGVVIGAAACGGQPSPPPEPAVDSAAIRDSIAQARQDSIRRAEAARRDSIQRAERIRRQAIEDSLARVRAETEEVRRMVARRIHFDFDRSNIRAGEDTEVLQQKLAILRTNSDLRIEIVGHCDERGSDEYNMALGMRRANSAKQWLVDRGIAANRITVRSMGEEQPIDPGHNEEAWAQNRRDEFNIVGGGDTLERPGM